MLSKCNIAAMQLHLDEIALAVEPGAHALLMLVQTGWHITDRLVVHPNITLLPLPPKAPELNPTGNVWQVTRDNCLSNRVFQSYDQPWCIMSLGLRQWAYRH